ncbi:unnamed protein product, partial [Soboliphyme baturini]|uniref:RUN domain-containing protein n=1 Tax=Soboliphyme baturini TaxID=241478 RepID=A0A183IZX4_9BILA
SNPPPFSSGLGTGHGGVGPISDEQEDIFQRQREKQRHLIRQLKEQLEDLERFAYESGDGQLPSNEIIAKQQTIISQLQNKMPLRLDNFEYLSKEELKKEVDLALRKLINPIKIKDVLVQQLQTQINDLERFIGFIQAENSDIHQTEVSRYSRGAHSFSQLVLIAVRLKLCPALRNLLQHGLLPPVSCLLMHGREFNSTPERKLTATFNLEQLAGKSVNSKQVAILSVIDRILTTHTPLRRSCDAMFKAFVSAALNRKKLPSWLGMILRSRDIVNDCYFPWSYAAKTGVDITTRAQTGSSVPVEPNRIESFIGSLSAEGW